MTSQQLALHIADMLEDKKALDVTVLDIGHLTVIADCFVIASGRSALQVKALYEDLDEKLSAEGENILRHDGAHEARWIVVDLGHVIVHLFHQEEREFYNIERLWMDGSNRLR